MLRSAYMPHMQDFSPLYSPFGPELGIALIPLIVALALWTVIIKGFALWHAARGGQRNWFIAVLVLNTLGILEVVYLIWFRKKASAHHSSAQA